MKHSPIIVAGLIGLALGYALFAADTGTHSDITFKPAMTLGDRSLPFSEAVQVGSMLYLSGQIGLPPGADALVAGGIVAETRQTMENIKHIVERHGSSMERIVKCTVFLADIAEWAEMNSVYVTYFADNPPARSALAVAGLALGARTEIECIAVTGR